jgi:ribose-phosphate pyrophosphokinase
METKVFADGELRVTFGENIRGKDVFLIQSCYAPSDNFMELCLMVQSAKLASARKIVAVLPYYLMSRQDRKDRPRVSVGAKLVADFLTASGATRIVSIDLHSDQTGTLFNIPFDQLFASYVQVPYIKNLNLDNLTVVAPDVGAAKKGVHMAGILKTEMVICHKHRNRDGIIDQMIVIGDVKDRDVILVDDIIDSGGTLIDCANLLKEKGAKSIRACIIHGVLSGESKQKIQDSVIEELIITDTIPLRLKENENFDKISVISISELLANSIMRIYEDKSVSELFRY